VVGRWLIDDADAAERRHRFLVRWRSVSGEVRDVQEDHALLFDERGNCTGDVVLVRDVTRETEFERLRSDFVARVSHELRTPLTPIRGFVQLLLRRGDRMTAEQHRDALTSVLDRTNHLGDVVEDLLLVTQMERDQLDGVVTPAALSVGDSLTTIVEEATAREPHRMIDLSLDPTTPHVWADGARLRQAVSAVVDNALRYSPVDEPVSLRLDQEEGTVCIRVHDHGPGIPPSHRDQVFERFQRLEDPMTMRTGGVGLGLFIARRLTEAMGGSLELERSAPGDTVFTFRLRAAEPPDVPGSSSDPASLVEPQREP
jgi:signal transduction histidine kinase